MRKIYCKQCNQELKGGFYNTPDGAFCSKCWKEKPKKEKDEALSDTLKGLAAIGSLFTK